MAIQDALRAGCRVIAPCAVATLATGTRLEWAAADIVALEIHEGADAALMPGSVLSASYALTLANPGHARPGYHNYKGATVQLYLDVAEGEAVHRAPLGVFIVDEISAPEQQPVLRLSGSDSIGAELGVYFDDELRYPCTLAALWAYLAGKSRYNWSGEVPNGEAVIDRAPDWGDCTLRQALGYAAMAAGCFVQLDRAGGLRLERCWREAAEARVTPSAYMTLTRGFETFGPVTGMDVTPVARKKAKTQTALVLGGGTTGERIQVKNNPVFVQDAAHLTELAKGMLAQISGMRLGRAELRWRGDPAVRVGTRLSVTDTNGEEWLLTVSRQTLRFEGGFSMTSSCATPSGGGMLRAITPEGGVNAAALVGPVDGGLLTGGSVTAHAIQAGAITTEKLDAGAITTDKLAAGVITAEKLAAGAIEAQAIEAVTGKFDRLTAGDIATDTLYAALAHVLSLAADSISAGEIEADRLAAVLARVTALTAQMADIDVARVKDLTTDTAIFQQGVGGALSVNRLAATSSMLLSSVLGELVVKGQDGKYYEIAVQADGTLATRDVTVTEGEISAAETASGRKIVETDLLVRDLNAENVAARQAEIAEIVTSALSAGQITAVEAMLATARVPQLYATAIQSLGSSIDISANDSITLAVNQAVERAGGEGAQAVSSLMRLEADGLHVGARVDGALSTAEVLVDYEGMSVAQGQTVFSRFASNFVQFGRYRIYLTTERGLAFNVV